MDETTIYTRLDQLDPHWSHVVTFVATLKLNVVVCVRLTLNGISREGLGVSSSEAERWMREAERDGLEDAASKFDAYRGWCPYEEQQPARTVRFVPNDEHEMTVKKSLINQEFEYHGWDASDIKRHLARFGLSSLDQADLSKLNEIYADMRSIRRGENR